MLYTLIGLPNFSDDRSLLSFGGSFHFDDMLKVCGIVFKKYFRRAPKNTGALKPSIDAPEIVAQEKYLHRLHRKWSSLQLISSLKQKSTCINTLIIESQ
jgi:hypothetical protein